MKKYILKRILCLIPILILISFVSFFMIHLSPGDPAQIYLSANGDIPSAEAIATLREELGLNKPLFEQYTAWLGNIFQGDLGNSISTQKSVVYEIANYFPNTLKLTALAMLLTLLISLPLGILSAIHENKLVDNVIRVGTFITSSLPGFFAALLMIYLFAVKLKWLPSISTGSSAGIILPALTLAVTLSAAYIRQIRSALIKELGEEYIFMLRARGIKERVILYTNALKSTLPTILTIAGLNIGRLLGGTAIIEMVCTYPGLGRLAIQAITNRDYPLVQGYVLVMATIYVLVNLGVDLLHACIDPRVKYSIQKENSGGLFVENTKMA
ncbi:MAG: ABC transporter permease [Paludibacter sp.]|jgi:ABC-type dipeptide/oligopeptide/nickel transport system permease component|nr:ABC transporter permease [Paludibacter sp.]